MMNYTIMSLLLKSHSNTMMLVLPAFMLLLAGATLAEDKKEDKKAESGMFRNCSFVRSFVRSFVGQWVYLSVNLSFGRSAG